MLATRIGAAQPLPSDRYCCRRCGTEKECAGNRPKPTHCADCRSVLTYREPDPPKPPPVLPDFTPEERLEGHRAYNAGMRDEETRARNRAYERLRIRERKSTS